jgi:hypothetical protein
VSGTLARYGARIAIAVAGLAIAAGIVATDDRDPFVFAIPALALTAVLVLALTLADRRGEDAEVALLSAETGLDDDGVRPLPAVTPILAGVREPAHVVAGDLAPGGPLVRVARVRDRLVAITDAPSPALDAGTRAWLADHPLGAEAEIEDGLLVVAVHRDAPPAGLVAVTRELYARS